MSRSRAALIAPRAVLTSIALTLTFALTAASCTAGTTEITSTMTADQIRLLQDACASRGLFYDQTGTCYEVDPAGLSPAELAEFRVAAATPPTPTPEPSPTPIPTVPPTPVATPTPRATTAPAQPPATPESGTEPEGDAPPPADPFRSLPPEASAEAEVHMVGVYEADRSGATTVTVSDVGAPVILVLSAYETIEWTVEIDDGAELEYVIVSGYYRQGVRIDADVSIYASSYEAGGSFPWFAAYQNDSAQTFDLVHDGEDWVCTDEPDTFAEPSSYLTALSVIEDLTGMAPRGIQGAYEGVGFAINELTRDASLPQVFEGGYCYEGMAGQSP